MGNIFEKTNWMFFKRFSEAGKISERTQGKFPGKFEECKGILTRRNFLTISRGTF